MMKHAAGALLRRITIFILLFGWFFGAIPPLPPEVHVPSSPVHDAYAAVPVIAAGYTSSTTSGNSLTLTQPSGVAADDLLILIVGNEDTSNTQQWNSFTDGSGNDWTLINEAGDTGSDCHVAALYRVATGTEGATVSVPGPTSNGDYWGAYVRVTGANPLDPLHVVGDDITVASAASVAIPSVTTTLDDNLAFFGQCYDGGNHGGFSVSGTGWSNTETFIAGDPTGNGTGGSFGTKSQSSTGATGDVTVSSALANGWSGFQFTIVQYAPIAPILYGDDGGSTQIAFNNSRQNSTTPTFRASSTYFTSFDRFQLELNPLPDFSGTSYTQTFSGTYASGTQYNLAATSLSPSLPTTDGVTYYVRVRASADSGSSYGRWSQKTWTYTYQSSGDTDWFQTTDDQFDGVLTLDNTGTSDANSLKLAPIPQTPPTYLGVSPHASGTTGITRTPDLTALSLAADDILIAHLVCRASNCASFAANGTITPPAGEGWTLFDEGRIDRFGGVHDASVGIYWKRWGAGDTDDTTPTFSWFSGLWGMAVSAFRGTIATGNPYEDSEGEPYTSALIMVAPTATSTGSVRLGADRTVLRLFASTDNNRHNANSEGVIAYGDAAYTQDAGGGYSISLSYLEDFDDEGSVGTATMNEATAGPDNSMNMTIVLRPPVPDDYATGTAMSDPIDFDSVLNASTWNQATWTEDETNGSLSVQVYYNNGSDCDTLIPNGDLAGNGAGFTSGPIDLSGLNTTTYNRICLFTSLVNSGGTPHLNDWTVSWSTGGGGSLTADIVDGAGSSVTAPSLSLSTSTVAFTSQVATGTLGTNDQRIRVTNGTASAAWSLTLAASSTTAFWEGASATYDFNDPTADGADGGDADALGGQLHFVPTHATSTPEGGCTNTDLSLGSAASFSEGSVDAITLATAGSGADTGCYWEFTGISASSTIPANQPADDYSIDMILTVTASLRREDGP